MGIRVSGQLLSAQRGGCHRPRGGGGERTGKGGGGAGDGGAGASALKTGDGRGGAERKGLNLGLSLPIRLPGSQGLHLHVELLSVHICSHFRCS